MNQMSTRREPGTAAREAVRVFSRAVLAVTVGAALVAAAGCASETDGARGDLVRLALDWTPNTNHAGVYVAQELGYYDEAGIDLEVLPFSQAGVESVMLAGGAEFGISGASSIIASAARGDDLQMVLNLQPKSSAVIAVTGENTEIMRPRDLDGKTFASWGAAETTAAVREMIRNDGGTGEFDQVVLGTSSYEMLYAGEADFAQSLTTWEGIEAELREQPLRTFAPVDYGVVVTPAELGFSVRTSYARANEGVVERFVGATQRGYEYAVGHPDEAADLLLQSVPEAGLDAELVRRSLRMLSAEYWPDAQGRVGYADLSAWRAYLAHLDTSGVLGEQGTARSDGSLAGLEVDALVTNRYLQ